MLQNEVGQARPDLYEWLTRDGGKLPVDKGVVPVEGLAEAVAAFVSRERSKRPAASRRNVGVSTTRNTLPSASKFKNASTPSDEDPDSQVPWHPTADVFEIRHLPLYVTIQTDPNRLLKRKPLSNGRFRLATTTHVRKTTQNNVTPP